MYVLINTIECTGENVVATSRSKEKLESHMYKLCDKFEYDVEKIPIVSPYFDEFAYQSREFKSLRGCFRIMKDVREV